MHKMISNLIPATGLKKKKRDRGNNKKNKKLVVVVFWNSGFIQLTIVLKCILF